MLFKHQETLIKVKIKNIRIFIICLIHLYNKINQCKTNKNQKVKKHKKTNKYNKMCQYNKKI